MNTIERDQPLIAGATSPHVLRSLAAGLEPASTVSRESLATADLRFGGGTRPRPGWLGGGGTRPSQGPAQRISNIL